MSEQAVKRVTAELDRQTHICDNRMRQAGVVGYGQPDACDHCASEGKGRRQWQLLKSNPVEIQAKGIASRGAARAAELREMLRIAREHLDGIACLTRELPQLQGVELLAYYDLRRAKLERFGLETELPESVKPPSRDTVNSWNEYLRKRGVRVINAT